MATVIFSPGQTLGAANTLALADGERLARLNLNPVRAGVPNLPVVEMVQSARVALTIDGASTMTVTLIDPDWTLEESGVLDTNVDGRLDAIDVTINKLTYRLSKASRNGDLLTLTFEDRVKSYLDAHTSAKSWSRGKFTRSQALEDMVREIRTTFIPFYSPEKGRRMPVERPDYPAAAPAQGETGFDTGGSFKIKGATADAAQMREVATAMTVADQLGVTPRVRLAMLVAGIGESAFRAVVNSIGYGGVFQGDVSHRYRYFEVDDTEGMARYFLQGGKGFQAGGAIALAKAEPSISVGTIATRVEASGEAGSFYDKYRKEADAIVAAWSGGDQSGAAGHEVLRVKSYQFTRGQPGKKETSYEAAVRWATEVDWRFYIAGGVACFNRDDFLILAPASMTISSPTDDRLITRPSYDWDHGKVTQTLDLEVYATRWSIVPGSVVAFVGSKWGPVKGKWLVQDVDQNLQDATDCTVTLIKPLQFEKEPAPDLVASAPSSGKPSTGAATAIAWAKSKIGHYAENLGQNRGTELDNLEHDFNLVGQAWCAMFATTAVAQAVGDVAKTPSVAQIRQWAMEGSHGYERGLRGTALPGDLILPHNESHVGIVEKVNSRGVTSIEGSTSAGKVARVGRARGDYDIVRPAYAT